MGLESVKKGANFDPIPVSYTKLLLRLLQNQLVARVPMKPHKPPFPRWYNPNSYCDYHSGVQGHSTENCLPLNYKVQLLIKARWLDFNKSNGPNVSRIFCQIMSDLMLTPSWRSWVHELRQKWMKSSHQWMRCTRN